MIPAITFNTIVNEIYKLPIENRLELKDLLEHNIADSRRNEIFANYKQANKAYKDDELKFSSDINELKNML